MYYGLKTDIESHFLPRETVSGLIAEGIPPLSVLSELKNLKRKKTKDATKVISKITEIAAIPPDQLATRITDGFLSTLQLIRSLRLPIPLFAWEKWWKTQKAQNGSESMNAPTQQEMAVAWLTDSIFPQAILNEVEKLSPGLGHKWQTYFEDVAKEYLYAPSRRVVNRLIGSMADGASSVSIELIAGLGLAKAISPILLASVETSADQFLNKIWGMYGHLAADLRPLVKNSKSINIDLDITRILNGSIDEISHKLAIYGLVATLIGLNVGVTGVAVVEQGWQEGLLRGAISTFSTTMAALFFLTIVPKLFNPVSIEFGDIDAALIQIIKGEEIWGKVQKQSEFSREFIDTMHRRYQATRRKNVSYEVLSNTLPAWLAVLLSQRGGTQTLVGQLYLVSEAIRQSVELLSTHLTFQSRKKNKTQGIKELITVFKELSTGEWGRLTQEKIEPWMKEADAADALSRGSIELQLKSLSLPEFTNNQGEQVNKALFQEHFSIGSGQIAMITGGNGSGKSILLRTLAGQHSGSLEHTQAQINGVDLRCLTPSQRSKHFQLISGLSSDFNLKQTVATILLSYRNDITQTTFDEARLKRWVISSEHDSEIEQLIINYINSQSANITINPEWFSDHYDCSGFQRTTLAFLLYFSIKDPIVLMVDELEGSMTKPNLELIARLISNKIHDFPGALLVAPNKWFSTWYTLPQTVGYIDMRQELAGVMKHRQENDRENNTLLLEDMNKETQSAILENTPITIEAFIMYVRTYIVPLYEERGVFLGETKVWMNRHRHILDSHRFYEWMEEMLIYILSVNLPLWSAQIHDIPSSLKIIRAFLTFFNLLNTEPGYMNLNVSQGTPPRSFWHHIPTPLVDRYRTFLNSVIFPKVQEAYVYIQNHTDENFKPLSKEELGYDLDLLYLSHCFELCFWYLKLGYYLHSRMQNSLRMPAFLELDPTMLEGDYRIPLPSLSAKFRVSTRYCRNLLETQHYSEVFSNPLFLHAIATDDWLRDQATDQFVAVLIPSLNNTELIGFESLLKKRTYQFSCGEEKTLWDILDINFLIGMAIQRRKLAMIQSVQ